MSIHWFHILYLKEKMDFLFGWIFLFFPGRYFLYVLPCITELIRNQSNVMYTCMCMYTKCWLCNKLMADPRSFTYLCYYHHMTPTQLFQSSSHLSPLSWIRHCYTSYTTPVGLWPSSLYIAYRSFCYFTDSTLNRFSLGIIVLFKSESESISLSCVPKGSNGQQASMGSGNGLVLKRQQSITWTSVGQDLWCHMVYIQCWLGKKQILMGDPRPFTYLCYYHHMTHHSCSSRYHTCGPSWIRHCHTSYTYIWWPLWPWSLYIRACDILGIITTLKVYLI